MKKATTGSEITKYREAQKRYLDASRVYARALSAVSELSPNIVKIVKDIHQTGTMVSTFDSPTITGFYNDLKKNSKIDPKYREAYHSLIKSKNALEHAAYALNEARIDMVLKKAGIVKVKHNKDAFSLVGWVNNPKASPLERISVALPFLKDEIIRLENYIDNNEIEIKNGEIRSSTRDARNFIRQLENLAITRVNDNYFSKRLRSPREIYPLVSSGKVTALELIRDLGDSDHVREFERRLAAGDITLAKDNLQVLTDKGTRYQRLLDEEMRTRLERVIDESFLAAHKEAITKDPLLREISRVVDSLSANVSKHLGKVQRLDFDNAYTQLTKKTKADVDNIETERQALFSDLGHLANSAITLRKQLLALSSGALVTEKALPILTGMRMLETYEDRVNQKIAGFSQRLGVKTKSIKNDIRPLSAVFEDYKQATPVPTDDRLGQILPEKLGSRYQFRTDLSGIISGFINGSSKYRDYLDAMNREKALTDYLFDYLRTEPRLHHGAAEMAQIISEIIEIQVGKEELLSEVIHEIELTHKKLWLAEVKKQNGSHIEKNIKPISEESARTASGTNTQIISQGEKNIEELIRRFSSRHDQHAQEFLAELAMVSTRVKAGEDVVKVSADIRSKYLKYRQAHETELANLEVEMKRLDRAFTTIGEKSRKMIEKTLINDITKKTLS